MPKRTNLNSILIIGSGPIIIGQACEFDYSGSQALRSLNEDGIETILINSNPATIMTDPSMANHVYLKQLTTKSIKEILKKHKLEFFEMVLSHASIKSYYHQTQISKVYQSMYFLTVCTPFNVHMTCPLPITV